jgi:2-octaprenyl-6-methoxyphenol hydroxylase
VLILGNAAHAIHPIAAQGFNLGLRDVAVLVADRVAALEAAFPDELLEAVVKNGGKLEGVKPA